MQIQYANIETKYIEQNIAEEIYATSTFLFLRFIHNPQMERCFNVFSS